LIKLKGKRHFLWRNIHAPTPVLAGSLALGDAFGWTTAALSPAQRALFQSRLPGVIDERGTVEAAGFVARIAQRLQLIGDITPPLCGLWTGLCNPQRTPMRSIPGWHDISSA
jgi:hypothetical protein